MKRLLKVSVGLLAFVLTQLTSAHDGRPVYLEVTQLSAAEYELAWRLAPALNHFNLPAISLQGECKTNAVGGADRGFVGKRHYQCSSNQSTLQVAVDYPSTNPSLSSIVRVQLLNFPAKFVHAGPGVTVIEIPLGANGGSIFSEYTRLGVEHILGGYDHLLFLVCVIWLAFTWRRIVLAVTGFTIAHSITLALAAFELITPAIDPTEALIALSIVFVAAELVRQKKDSLSWRFPVVVSSLFGLLHGLGFAGVLKEVGLPTNDALLALFAFNIGVEAGQLLFVCALLMLVWVIVRMSASKINPSSVRTQTTSGYVVGTLAAFWFLQRFLVLF